MAQADIPTKLSALREELQALDAVIPLHEVPVDPKAIRGCKPKGPALSSYGDLTVSAARQSTSTEP